ncbi:DUF1538 domain-containing protein [Clostridium sp. MD294]|uniref:DUF1538 domain-containing protein n=1 Tax=Clostridium sp. MD294 TaxID=97138 RepID=UPI0002CBF9B4|nr:DUF1538 domain-containing protein [Clostridium sp. MD294]NDO45707.1 DUF1538 domain-containing protein [Clostridium sp. MD294]USF30640.1 hypothetical protein C820_002083 [Clostridium sp. MD294]
MYQFLKSKVLEALSSVIPIVIIVLVLNFTIVPMPWYSILLFLIGSIFLIFGMGLFTLGADIAMIPMGERVGAQLTKSRNLIFLILISLLFGMMITIAEPDLQVLATQVPSIPNMTLILSVAIGVGCFLVLALLRILFQISLVKLLVIFYVIVFILAYISPTRFLAVAFDSGGVTTGPITVPFIMALGLGVASVRGDKNSQEDSFGLISLCSIGPILAVLFLGLFFGISSEDYVVETQHTVKTVKEILFLFLNKFPHHFIEVAIALSPVVIFFLIFQKFYLKLPKHYIRKIYVGIMYTYIGLVCFLTGVNAGFMPIGNYIGNKIAQLYYNWILVPIGIIIGMFVVIAEPAVHVLTKQVEEITGGNITKKAILISLSCGVGISIGLAMIRVLTNVPIWYFLIPGYGIAILLSHFVPKIFTAIAFDSGGVASGPMTATFLLPLAMGACQALNREIMTNAFGIVAMVAMTPLVTIQILGLIYTIGEKRRNLQTTIKTHKEEDNDIIEF